MYRVHSLETKKTKLNKMKVYSTLGTRKNKTGNRKYKTKISYVKKDPTLKMNIRTCDITRIFGWI